MGVWRIHGRGAWNGLDPIGQDSLALDCYERLARATDGRYDATLRRLIRSKWYRLALEHSRRGDTRAARQYAWRVLRERSGDGVDLRRLVRLLAHAHLRRAGGRLGLQGR
jgi:hypothetical protein